MFAALLCLSPLLLGAADGFLNADTQAAIATYVPYVIIAVMAFMLLDRKRDKFREILQGISDALKSIGWHEVPPLIDAVVRGDWEAAKALWDVLKKKYGSAEGILEAVAVIIEESLEKVMDVPKLKTRLMPVFDKVAVKLGYAPPAPPAPPAAPAAKPAA